MTAPASVPAAFSPVRAVTAFLLAGLVVLGAVGAVLGVVQHRQAEADAVRHALALTEDQAGFLELELQDEALVPGAQQRQLDRLVQEQVIGEQVVRVKLWTQDGTIVYSDDASLIGERFVLSPEEQAVFTPGTEPVAEVSDLDEDENQSQQGFDQLLQVYVAVETPGGTPLLYETYQSYDSIAAVSRQRTLSFLPVLVGALALLWLAQAPLAWRLASRLRAAHDERELLLVAALAASDRERQRIAADLHDGVVQGLSGASYTLTAEASRLAQAGHADVGAVLHGLAVDLRRSVRELRGLIVTITPPGLRRQPLVASLKDLVAPLEDRGIGVQVQATATDDLDQPVLDLVLRTAQEAVRNVLRHSGARQVVLDLRVDDDEVVLTVTDDGVGFSAGTRPGRPDSMGIDLLGGLAQSEGGRIEVRSGHGRGTTLELRVPRHVHVPVPA